MLPHRKLHGHGRSSTPALALVSSACLGGALQWPIFKWAGGKDDAYFAKLSKNAISVYQAPDMGLLDKRSLKMEAVQDFVWSPSDPILSAYTAEQGNLPARIVLVKIPERVEVRQKNLFSVSGTEQCADMLSSSTSDVLSAGRANAHAI
eukprot:364496-Chlamydomonas_euryale.AAC.46